jgi:hypothetical protein
VKIWLKSPDPNKQCCDCSVKKGPCDFCCSFPLISGNNHQFYIKDIYNGNCYTPDIFGPCGIGCETILPFSPPTGSSINLFNNPVNRSFTSSNFFPIGIPVGLIDGSENVGIDAGGNLNNAISSNIINFNYTLQSNNAGLNLNSTTETVDVLSERCSDGAVAINLSCASLTEFQAAFSSGESIIFNFQGNVQRQCKNGISDRIIPGSTTYFLEQSCLDGPLFFSWEISRTSTGHNPWFSTGNISFTGNFVSIDSFFGTNNGFDNTTQTSQLSEVDAFCNDNFLPSEPAISPCLSFFTSFVGPGSCVAIRAGPGGTGTFQDVFCCVKGGAGFSTPSFRAIAGQVTIKFLSSECVHFINNETNTFFQTQIQIIGPTGQLINPMSRLTKLSIDTGTFPNCNLPP